MIGRKFILAALIMMVQVETANAQTCPNTHSVWVQQLLYFKDGRSGVWYDALAGKVTMNWKSGTPYAFFNAQLTILTSPTRLNYTFQLVKTTGSTPEYIEGLWDIRENNKKVCKRCAGRAYGLDGVADGTHYFKLYTGTDSSTYGENWHVSGFITERLDYCS